VVDAVSDKIATFRKGEVRLKDGGDNTTHGIDWGFEGERPRHWAKIEVHEGYGKDEPQATEKIVERIIDCLNHPIIEVPGRDRMLHLGALGLLADCSVHLAGAEAEEMRQSIEACLSDAVKAGIIYRYKRILNHIEILPCD